MLLHGIVNFAAEKCTLGNDGFFGFPTWYKYLGGERTGELVDGTRKCEVAFSLMKDDKFNGGDLLLVAISIVDMLIRLVALVAVFFVMYGGIRYITSQGSPDGTKAAQGTIMNALIGLAIAITASALVAFIGAYIK